VTAPEATRKPSITNLASSY